MTKKNGLYYRWRNVLAQHTNIPKEISQWYILLLISIVLLVVVVVFYHFTRRNNIPMYRQVSVGMGEMGKKGDVDYLKLVCNIVPGYGTIQDNDSCNIQFEVGRSWRDYRLSLGDMVHGSTGSVCDTMTLYAMGYGKSISDCGSECGFVKFDEEDYNYRVAKYLVIQYGKDRDTLHVQYRIMDGLHNIYSQKYILRSKGEDVFYPKKNAPADFNLFLQISAYVAGQPVSLQEGSDSEIILNLDTNYSWFFNNIFPKPSKIAPDQVAYIGTDAVQSVLENDGVYLQVSNETIRTKNQRMQYMCTILISALLAFIFDIVIRLVILWKDNAVVQAKDADDS